MLGGDSGGGCLHVQFKDFLEASGWPQDAGVNGPLDQIRPGSLHNSYIMKDAEYTFGFACLAAEDQERAETGGKEEKGGKVLVFPHTPCKVQGGPEQRSGT